MKAVDSKCPNCNASYDIRQTPVGEYAVGECANCRHVREPAEPSPLPDGVVAENGQWYTLGSGKKVRKSEFIV